MKKLMAAVLAAMMVLSLSACSSDSDQGESSSSTTSQNSSSSSQVSEVTADSLTQKMIEATTFNDEVIAISADVVPNYYTIPDSVEDYAVYMCPTGATVEEISVFRTSDAAAVEEMIQTHLAEGIVHDSAIPLADTPFHIGLPAQQKHVIHRQPGAAGTLCHKCNLLGKLTQRECQKIRAVHQDGSALRTEDMVKAFEQRAFPGAVVSKDSQKCAVLGRKGDVP